MTGLTVVLNTNMLAELRRSLPRLVHRHGLTPAAIDEPIDTLAHPAELVDGLFGPLAPSFPVAAPAPLANSRMLMVTSGAC